MFIIGNTKQVGPVILDASNSPLTVGFTTASGATATSWALVPDSPANPALAQTNGVRTPNAASASQPPVLSNVTPTSVVVTAPPAANNSSTGHALLVVLDSSSVTHYLAIQF